MKGLPRREKLRIALEAALDKAAEDPLALDVRGVVSFADTFLILTGRSDRHVEAIADAVEAALVASGESPLGVEGKTEGRWALLDFGDLIVHVFVREAREAYALERLWSDAAAIRLAGERARRAAQRPRSEPQASGARAPASKAATSEARGEARAPASKAAR
jgi:ribosome-associated protein